MKTTTEELKLIEKRFWTKVQKGTDEDCWLWQASVMGTNGYGSFRLNIELGTQSAHRYSYELRNGTIPTGYIICHTCDTPRCVNPQHLFIGTHQDNALDRESKNRSKTHGIQKLTETQVIEIKSSSESQSKLAAKFNVSRSTIKNIQYGLSWTHIKSNNENYFNCKICDKESSISLFKDSCYDYRKISDDICLKCQKALILFNNDIKIINKAIKYLTN